MTRDEAAMALIVRVLAREGGIADVGDGAGVTRFGQTPAWLHTFGLAAPETAAEAARNYQVWLVRTGLIGLCDYADDFADATIDFAVNAGHRQAIRALQSVLGLRPDGIYGPETQARVDQANRPAMARRVIGQRLRYLGSLIASKPDRFAKFAGGWTARVAAQVEALA